MPFPIIPGGSPSSGYQVSRSLRFRNSATSYLQRTPASAGSRTAWTWSGWVKIGLLSGANNNWLFFAGTNATTDTGLYHASDNTIGFFNRASSTINGFIITSAVFRDVSAWYHITAVYDASNATPTDRMRLYVNGVRQNVTVNTQLASGTSSTVNNTVGHYIGSIDTHTTANNLDGYLAEVNFIDGQALTPSSFGQSNALTGVWEPKQYTGTYGANGFYLPYSDPSGSGNGNDTYTKLLLHGNGLNDSAWNGSSNHALTAFGSATTSTTQTKFGMSSSLYTLGSSSQYFRTDASADFKYAAASGSTNDFTFDFWFYPGASGTTQPVISIADTTYSSLLIYGTQLYSSSNNTGWDVSIGQSIGTPVTGQWNHYAIVRSGSTWYTFLNGVQQATWTNSLAGYDYTTNNFIQFGRAQGGALYSTGYYAEARWSAGIARWTSTFTPPTAPYSGGAGSDSSGNVNAWRPFNINTATSGTTYDSMIDSPTNYADGGNGRGNYCVLSPLDINVSNTQRPTDGNLTYPVSSAVQYSARGTIFVSSGKWYAEFTISSSAAIVAVVNSSALLYGYTAANGIFTSTTSIFNNGTQVQSGLTAFSANDVIGVAFDADANTVQFYKNGSTYGTAVTISTFSGPYTFQTGANGATCTINANFGQQPFRGMYVSGSGSSFVGTGAPPSGYSALNTQNLPAPALTPSP